MQVKPSPLPEEIDDAALMAAVEEAIKDHGGDAKAALKSLLVSNAFLEAARDRALDLVSTGYARGKLP